MATTNQRTLKTKKPEKPPERVRCRECAAASSFTGNGCFCAAKGRRVCACDRYGRVCAGYVAGRNAAKHDET